MTYIVDLKITKTILLVKRPRALEYVVRYDDEFISWSRDTFGYIPDLKMDSQYYQLTFRNYDDITIFKLRYWENI
jgi:hypothetical protein